MASLLSGWSHAAITHAIEMAEDFPDVSSDSDAWTAVTPLAERRLPGLVVTSAQATPEPALLKADDTIVEVAAVMARLRSPLAAVMDGEKLVGVITASRLLQLSLVAG